MSYSMAGHDTREFWNAFHVLTRDLDGERKKNND